MKSTKNMSKRALSLLLALVMCFGMVNLSAFAVTDAAAEHSHNQDGWTCTQAEPTQTLTCTHVHDELCGYVEAKDEVPCTCDAVADEETGETTHEEGCAYQPAVEGVDCSHEHTEACYTTTEGAWTCTPPVVEVTETTDNALQAATFDLRNNNQANTETKRVYVYLKFANSSDADKYGWTSGGYQDWYINSSLDFSADVPTGVTAADEGATSYLNDVTSRPDLGELSNHIEWTSLVYQKGAKEYGVNGNAWHLNGTVDFPTNVYVYVRLPAGAQVNDWKLNNDAWYTIGRLTVPSNVLPSAATKPSTDKYNNATWETGAGYTAVMNALPNIVWHESNKIQQDRIDLSRDVDWEYVSGKNYLGLHTSNGATDYPEANGANAWHLDGNLKPEEAADIDVTYTVRYYDVDTDAEIKAADTRTSKLGKNVSVTDTDKAEINDQNSTYTFVENENRNVLSVLLTEDGLELKLYFKKSDTPPAPEEPNITVTKKADKNGTTEKYFAGDDVTWTITVKNEGNTKVGGLSVVDTLKGVTVTAKNGNWDPDNFSLEAGAEATFTATLPSAAEGFYYNHVEVKKDGEKLVEANAPATVNPAPESDYTITKTADKDTVNAGDIVTFTITVTSKKATPEWVTIRDYLPAGLEKVGGNVVARLQVGGGYTANLVVKAKVTEAGTFTNKGVVQLPDGSTMEDTATVTGVEPNLTIAKTVSKTTASVGDKLAYTITVTNSGDGEAKNITLKDYFKSGDTAQSGLLSWKDGKDPTKDAFNVPARDGEKNGEATFTAYYDVEAKDAGKTLTNSAVLAGNDEPDAPQTSVTVQPRLTGISKELVSVVAGSETLSAPYTVKKGTEVTLTYKITVTGDEGAKYEVFDADVALAEGLSWTGTLDESGKAEITVAKTVTVDDAMDVTNTAFVKPGEGTDPIPPVDPEKPDEKGHPSDEVKTEIKVTEDPKPDPEPETVKVTWLPGYGDNDPIKVKDDHEKGAAVPQGDYPANPTRPGYTFTGWGEPVTDEDGNITITAQWRADDDRYTPTNYTLTYNANGGTGAPNRQTGRGNITMRTGEPTREGYTFQGWATSRSGDVVYLPGDSYRLNANATVYAVWSPVVEIDEGDTPLVEPDTFKLTVHYVYADGSTAAEDSVKDGLLAGDSYSVVSPVLEGYTVDYELVAGTMPGEDLEFTVVYTPVETEVPEEQPPLVEVPEEQPPLVDVPEEQPPLVDIPVVTVPAENVPVVTVPVEDVPLADIPDEDVPMVGVPQTGDFSMVWCAAAMMSVMGLIVLTFKKREDEEI